MKLDIVSCPGSIDKPAIVFIHGLGMNRDIWINPSESRILGGIFPLGKLLGKKIADRYGKLQTLFDDLKNRNYPVIAWSQKRPAAPIHEALPELEAILNMYGRMTESGVILIGHSRGGLIGRKYLSESNNSLIRGLITISTPHKGSYIARFAGYLSPFASLLNPLFPEGDKGTLFFSVKRILQFLRSRALRELLPDSGFFKSLRDGPIEGICYASAGGTNPTLFELSHYAFPDLLENIIPGNIYPEEIKQGKGDGLVSAESSRLPWCDQHYDVDCNHAEILFDRPLRNILVQFVEGIARA